MGDSILMAVSVGDRIRAIRTARGMTLEQLAFSADVDAGGLSKLERGLQGYSDGMLRQLSAALGVPIADFFAEESNVVPAMVGTRAIPLLDAVQAGKWRAVRARDAGTDAEPTEFIVTDLLLGPDAFAMRIRGESMEPRFREGDVVICDPAIHPHPGDFVVASNGSGEAVFKQYRLRGINDQGQEVFELLSLNKLFPSIRSDTMPTMRVVGTMVEHRTYRRR